MPEQIELKPCRFCGSKENEIKEYWMRRNRKMWYIRCCGCWYESECFRTKEEAAEAWNRRCNDVGHS